MSEEPANKKMILFKIFRVIVKVVIVFVGIMILLMAGLAFLLQIAFNILFGWIHFIINNLENIQISLANIGYFLLLQITFFFTLHYIARWLSKSKWHYANTAKIQGLILGLFVLGVASIGITHQLYWIGTETRPLLKRRPMYAAKKTKTSEAKVALATVYTALQANYDEHGEYNLCFDYNQRGNADYRYYVVGFHSAVKSEKCQAKNNHIFHLAGKEVAGLLANPDMIPKDCIISEDGQKFKICAVGHITIDPKKLDIWSLNEKKTFQHEQVGY